MKLIDLLVQELPKRGGWPEGIKRLNQGYDGEIEGYRDDGDSYGLPGKLKLPLTENHRFECQFVYECQADFVTREQYEAAISESRQPEWNGGIPPVSTECEIFDCEKWLPVRIKYVGDYLVVVKELDGSLSERVFHIAKHPDKFRPTLTEEERKREEADAALKELKPQLVGHLAGILYDQIAAGKIPHITLK